MIFFSKFLPSAALILLPCLSSAAQFEVAVTPGPSAIDGLELSIKPLSVEVDRSHQNPRGYVTLSGRFKDPDGSLLIGDQKATVSENGNFSEMVFVESTTQTVPLRAVAATGAVETSDLRLNFPKSGEFKVFLREIATERKDFVRLSAGPTSVWYSQSGLPGFVEENFTLQGFYTRVLNRSVSLNIGGFYSLPVHSNESGNTISFLGINARVGYSPSWPDEPWKLTLFTGGYYVTTVSAQFGYQLLGPQLFPYLERIFPSGNSISAYVKYSPLRNSDNSFAFSNREIAGGVGYTSRLDSGHPVTFNVDYAQLNFSFDGQGLTQSTLSISAGYGF